MDNIVDLTREPSSSSSDPSSLDTSLNGSNMKCSAAILYPNATVAESVTTYSEEHSLSLPQYIKDYHAQVIAQEPESRIMISTFQAQSLLWLARLVGAKRVLEIGVYVGFSAIVWSYAVGPEGFVTGLEVDESHASKAETAFFINGNFNVQIIRGPAIHSLPTVANTITPYDIIFIDAAKTEYSLYLRAIIALSTPGMLMRLLRPGGVIIVDNVLRGGVIADASENNPNRDNEEMFPGRPEYWKSEEVRTIREFNELVRSCARLESWMVPLWDGVMLVRLVD